MWPDREPYRGVSLPLSLVPLGPDPEVPRAVPGGDGWKASFAERSPSPGAPAPCLLLFRVKGV